MLNKSAYPGLSLYPTWNNEYVQAYGDAIVPESYKVDLTGFCMLPRIRRLPMYSVIVPEDAECTMAWMLKYSSVIRFDCFRCKVRVVKKSGTPLANW